MRSYRGFRCLSLVACLIVAVAATSAFSADHRDAPLILGSEKQDLNDIYVFQSPANPNNAVFILTVNPFIGMFAEDGTLDPNTVYEFLIDTNGDAREDINFAFFFSRPNALGQQSFIMQSGRSTLARGTTGQNVAVTGGGTVRVSIQDDPFFFDTGVVPGNPGGTNTDTFANANITAITLEIPRRNLRVNNMGVWAITEVQGRQVDRTALPGLNTVLLPDNRYPVDRRDAFNAGLPVNDVANFTNDVVNVLRTDFGRTLADSQAIAGLLLPDIANFNSADASGFLNGRRLEDDVIDVELQVLTGDPNATDGVDANDKPFSNTFPYLASPHP